MKRIAFHLAMIVATLGVMDRAAAPSQAQYPGQTTVYQTAIPGPPVVTYGEAYKVRYKRHRTIIKERPVAYVRPTAPVIRETRVVQSAPIVEQRIVQPAPIVEQRIVQPAPIVESRVIQPSPVIRTQYYGPAPY